MPKLLEAMGVTCIKINCEPTGNFALPRTSSEHLKELSTKVVEEGADLGISVDPDVDRLALICEDGTPFGEEYTLVAAADYILEKRKGATVSNLSSSRAVKDITEVAGCVYSAAAVGEINVVNEMKRVNAVIGGEGNGGVIVPDFHYGRDALIGTALILSHIANKKIKASSLRDSYPKYYISKNKIELSDKIDVGYLFEEIKKVFSNNKITDIDGVKIDFDKEKKMGSSP
jgi:phosphomannomutase